MPNVLNNKGAFWCHKHNCAFTGFQFDLYCGKCVMAQEALLKPDDYFEGIRSAFHTDTGRVSYKQKDHRATIIKHNGETKVSPSGSYSSYVAELNWSRTAYTHVNMIIELWIPYLAASSAQRKIWVPNTKAQGWNVGDIVQFNEEWIRAQSTVPVFMMKADFIRQSRP